MLSAIQNLCLLIVVAHLLGRMAERLRQPELLGHMLAGVLLGPALLGWISPSAALNAVGDLAVLIVVISAGLEMRLRSITQMFRGKGLLALLPGLLIPLLSGFVLARLFSFSLINATVIALCIAVTALPVALRILSGFGLMGTRLANVTIAGALLADITVLLALGVLRQGNALTSSRLDALIPLAMGKLLVLLCVIAGAAWLCSALHRRYALLPRQQEKMQLSVSLLVVLTLAFVSDALGFHFAIGAFFGALIANEQQIDGTTAHPLKMPLEGVTHTLFAPLFLAMQGLHFNADDWARPAFSLWLIAIAIGSKLVGGYWSARWCGLDRHDAQGVAIVMNARGLMEMVIASIAYQSGLIDAALFATLLLVGCLTTVITPLLLRVWQKQPKAAGDAVTDA